LLLLIVAPLATAAAADNALSVSSSLLSLSEELA
jgi:hypothetical protein